MVDTTVTCEEFIAAAIEFVKISDRLCDGWKLIEHTQDINNSYLKKETFIELENDCAVALLKSEFVIFYNVSYGVPAFSFNIWNSSGVLLTLEEIRQMAFNKISEKDFYSVLTQQEHPVLHRPYFIMHPCHTESLMATFKNKSKNIIVTFLGLITPLIRLNLPFEYGLSTEEVNKTREIIAR